jgi:hypothetical protein
MKYVMPMLALLGIGAAFAFSAACSSDDGGSACSDGDRLQCTCASGATGTKTCSAGAFSECACADAGTSSSSSSSSSSSGGTGGHEGGAPAIDAGFGNYLGGCDKTEDCPDGGTCFAFGTKGMICTHTCTGNEQCEAPSPKCNPKGVCAVPD